MKCSGKLGEAVSTSAETSVPKLEDLHAQLQTLIPDTLAQNTYQRNKKSLEKIG